MLKPNQEDKKTWTWCTTAQVISATPVRLYSILMTPSAATSECKIYDGESASDPPIVEIYSSVRITRHYHVHGGIKTHRGLYVGAFTGVTGVLVVWEPLESEGE